MPDLLFIRTAKTDMIGPMDVQCSNKLCRFPFIACRPHPDSHLAAPFPLLYTLWARHSSPNQKTGGRFPSLPPTQGQVIWNLLNTQKLLLNTQPSFLDTRLF